MAMTYGKEFGRRFLTRIAIAACIASVSSMINAQRQTAVNVRSTPSTSLNIQTEPNAIVWLDDIRRGVSDASGKLSLMKVSPGRHLLRVRAIGFKEASLPLLPGRHPTVAVRLVPTTDKAELAFQQAEDARDKAKDDELRQRSVELYRRALQLRPAFPAAHLGLARALMDLNQNEKALAEIESARTTRPVYPEASAVEGRIYREMAFADEAVKSFQRAIREARGFQPEAHVGLARMYEDRGQYASAATEFQTAINQLSDSEPVIYQLLGATYEKLEQYKEAVAAYEKYLQLAPAGSLAPALRSIIDQLRRQAAGEQIIPE
jgi:tetratricopeptide (TPR) repeat protein